MACDELEESVRALVNISPPVSIPESELEHEYVEQLQDVKRILYERYRERHPTHAA